MPFLLSLDFFTKGSEKNLLHLIWLFKYGKVRMLAFLKVR